MCRPAILCNRGDIHNKIRLSCIVGNLYRSIHYHLNRNRFLDILSSSFTRTVRLEKPVQIIDILGSYLDKVHNKIDMWQSIFSMF